MTASCATVVAVVAVVCFALPVGNGDAHCQPLPDNVTKLVVGHPPGGQGDTVARIIAPKLAELWGRPVLVENRIGAAGVIAANYVAKSRADGHTLFIGASTNLAIATVMPKVLPFDATRDFAMVRRIARIPTVLAVAAHVPVRTVAELVAYAKSHPGQLTAASSGTGSTSGFTLEMFKYAADVDILQVPYNGLGPAVMGLLSGQVDIVFADLSLVKRHAETGALRLLGALGSHRLAVAPELPTMREQGLDKASIESSIGVAAPAGTPPETIARLARDLGRILRMPDVHRKLAELGFDPVDDTPAQYSASLRQDVDRFAVLARRLGIGAAN